MSCRYKMRWTSHFSSRPLPQHRNQDPIGRQRLRRRNRDGARSDYAVGAAVAGGPGDRVTEGPLRLETGTLGETDAIRLAWPRTIHEYRLGRMAFARVSDTRVLREPRHPDPAARLTARAWPSRADSPSPTHANRLAAALRGGATVPSEVMK